MPNWIFNDNVFYSTNKESIEDFHKKRQITPTYRGESLKEA